jgi:hypothetical protein
VSINNIESNFSTEPVAPNQPALLQERKVILHDPVQTAQGQVTSSPSLPAAKVAVVQEPGPLANVQPPRSAPRPIAPTTMQVVKGDLAKVRDAWQKYQSTHSRDAIYIYLGSVFSTVRRWRRQNRVTRKFRLALKLIKDPIDMGLEPFAVVLFCTSDRTKVDGKARSKWSRALRAVEAHKKKDETLKEFIKSRGGINSCAALLSNRAD